MIYLCLQTIREYNGQLFACTLGFTNPPNPLEVSKVALADPAVNEILQNVTVPLQMTIAVSKLAVYAHGDGNDTIKPDEAVPVAADVMNET